MTTFTNYWTNT